MSRHDDSTDARRSADDDKNLKDWTVDGLRAFAERVRMASDELAGTRPGAVAALLDRAMCSLHSEWRVANRKTAVSAHSPTGYSLLAIPYHYRVGFGPGKGDGSGCGSGMGGIGSGVGIGVGPGIIAAPLSQD